MPKILDSLLLNEFVALIGSSGSKGVVAMDIRDIMMERGYTFLQWQVMERILLRAGCISKRRSILYCDI